jgi:hypothetical protein
MVVSLVAPVGATPSADAPLPASAPPPSVMGLFVYPDSHAAREQRDWLAAGRVDDAELVARIADQPTPAWLTDPTDAVGNDVRTSARRAAAAGQRPLLVAYHLPGWDCGGFSGGGAADPEGYRAWIRQWRARCTTPPRRSSWSPTRWPTSWPGVNSASSSGGSPGTWHIPAYAPVACRISAGC